MKRTPLMFAVAALVSSLAGVAAAQPRVLPPPPGRALSQEAQLARAERWDLRTLEDLRERFASARARMNRAALDRVDMELERSLAAELRESRVEKAQARSSREVRQESRELRRIRAIARELQPLYRRYDRSSLARKSALLGELTQLARAELARERSERASRRWG